MAVGRRDFTSRTTPHRSNLKWKHKYDMTNERYWNEFRSRLHLRFGRISTKTRVALSSPSFSTAPQLITPIRSHGFAIWQEYTRLTIIDSFCLMRRLMRMNCMSLDSPSIAFLA
jgi:hypothetical protein